MDIEKMMKAIDFVQFSKVRTQLQQQLLAADGLRMDELDQIAAAGCEQSQSKKNTGSKMDPMD